MERSFTDMIDRFLTGSMEPEERAQFLELVRNGQLEGELDAAIDSVMIDNRYATPDAAQWKDDLYQQLKGAMDQEAAKIVDMQPAAGKASKPSFLTKYWWAAAVILIAFAALLYLIPGRRKSNTQNLAQTTSADILPGNFGAVLTLDDGSTVSLDSMNNGVVTQQDGVQIRLENNNLIYDQLAAKQGNGSMAFNTMTTPRGRQFVVSLPDGTKVWMNAASAIRYPARFDEKERLVQISGELYFEVAKDSKRPFKVLLKNGSAIDVLGTSFNINSYDDEEKISTTLIEGSIRVAGAKGNSVVLKPLQQSQMAWAGSSHQKENIEVLNDANPGKVLAWKNGAFDFGKTSLEEMMRQLSRWYDISVEYPQGVPAFEYEGKMSRNITLNGLLKILDQTGVHFRLEGKKLIVLP